MREPGFYWVKTTSSPSQWIIMKYDPQYEPEYPWLAYGCSARMNDSWIIEIDECRIVREQ